jgi:hypothetical protein
VQIFKQSSYTLTFLGSFAFTQIGPGTWKMQVEIPLRLYVKCEHHWTDFQNPQARWTTFWEELLTGFLEYLKNRSRTDRLPYKEFLLRSTYGKNENITHLCLHHHKQIIIKHFTAFYKYHLHDQKETFLKVQLNRKEGLQYRCDIYLVTAQKRPTYLTTQRFLRIKDMWKLPQVW